MITNVETKEGITYIHSEASFTLEAEESKTTFLDVKEVAAMHNNTPVFTYIKFDKTYEKYSRVGTWRGSESKDCILIKNSLDWENLTEQDSSYLKTVFTTMPFDYLLHEGTDFVVSQMLHLEVNFDNECWKNVVAIMNSCKDDKHSYVCLFRYAGVYSAFPLKVKGPIDMHRLFNSISKEP